MKKGKGRNALAFWTGGCCFLLVVLCLVLLTACGGGGGGSSSSTGTVSVGMTDGPAGGDYKAVYITVARVDVSTNGDSWQTVATLNKTYDLLEFRNGVVEALGSATLPAGQYAQIRLVLGDTPTGINILGSAHPYPNYFIDGSDHTEELKVPSGYQTGIKIVQGFEIHPNGSTELLLDFDAARSIVMAGSSGQWLLKPTIKVLTTIDYFIQGTVTTDGTTPAVGVLVSAQVFATPDTVAVQATAITDTNGYYKMFVAPGTYRVVGYKEGNAGYYSPAKIEAVANGTTHNFQLPETVTTGTATLSVSVGGGTGQSALVSIRQQISIDGTTEQIELLSQNVVSGGTWAVTLPQSATAYKVYAYPTTGTTNNYTLTISSTPATLNINL